MPIVITVAQLKGGVGKTTIAIAIAGELSRRDWDVALVDSDPQRSASYWAAPGNLHFPVYQIALATESVSRWVQDVRSIEAGSIVIDTAPSERDMGASIALSDLIVVPCTASGLDIEATERTMSIIEAVRNKRDTPLRVIIVPNRVDARTLEGRQLADELAAFGEFVSRPIAARSAHVRAFSSGHSIGDFAPNSTSDHEIRYLCDQIAQSLR